MSKLADFRDAQDLDEAVEAIRTANRRSRRETRERKVSARKVSLSPALDEWLRRGDDVDT